MTDAPEVRRRRRRRQRRSNPDSDRLLAWIGGIAVLLLIAAAIGFGLGRANDGVASVTPSPSTASQTAAASVGALPTGSALPGSTASADAATGIRATRIRSERLGIDLPIVAGDGIDAPMDQAAHYPGSAWPGGASNNTYIYGHAQEGMFIGLWEAQVGDEVVLELEDGTQRTYVVTEVLPEVAWDALEYTQPTSAEQLTLQTSTSDTMTAPRFVVIAVPQP